MRKVLSCIFKVNRSLHPKVNAIGIWKEKNFKNYPVKRLFSALIGIVFIQLNALSQISNPSTFCNLAVSISKDKTSSFGSYDVSLNANQTKEESLYSFSLLNEQSLK